MSRFSERFDSDAAYGKVLDEFSESITLRDPETDAEYETRAEVQELEGAVDPYVERKWRVSKSEIAALNPSSPITVEPGWQVIFGGERWTLLKVQDEEDGTLMFWARAPEEVR